MLTRDPLLSDAPERGGPPPPGCVAWLVAGAVGLVFYAGLALLVWRALS